MLMHDKQAARQFLLDIKSGPHNLIHSTATQQHARFLHQTTSPLTLSASPYQHHHSAYPIQLGSHSLSQHSMPTTIEQLEMYSAYAYQQQQQPQQTLFIGNGNDTINEVAVTRSQLAPGGEVLDLSRRDSVETTATSTTATRKTPSPCATNSSCGGAGSPQISPRDNLQQQQHSSSPGREAEQRQQSALLHSNLLYTAQAQLSRLAAAAPPPPLATLYPALYNTFGHLTNERVFNSANNSPPPTTAPSSPQPQLAPVATTLTPPSSVSATASAQTSSSPTASPLTVVGAVAAAATNMLRAGGIKMETEDCGETTMMMPTTTPLSPSSSLDGGRSRSPHRPNATAGAAVASAQHNPSTPNALKSTRPFKAFPRDPLVIAANFAATDVLLDNPRVERYTEYRKRVLEQIRSCNGGARTVTNPKMRRVNTARRNSNTSSNAPDCGVGGGYGGSSEGEERHMDESSDCDSSYAGGCGGLADKVSSSAHEDNNNNQLNQIKWATSGNNNNSSGNHSGGSQQKDAAYYERRRKNNAAAKKSRDRRRIKEDEIAIRAAYLERQNIELLCQIDALKAQLAAYTAAKVVSSA